MKNLAGDPKCDAEIRRELERCRIPVFELERDDRHREVPYTVEGRLGEFTFRRAWYYTVVKGPLPLAVAQQLYADPVGKTDIRVAGHCGCPPPEKPWVDWRLPDGTEVIDMKNKAEAERHAVAPNSPISNKIGREILQKFQFSDDPASLGAKAFVDSYHIDTELGLYIFAEALRENDLA